MGEPLHLGRSHQLFGDVVHVRVHAHGFPSLSRRTGTRRPLIVVDRRLSMMLSAASSGTSTSEKRAVILMAPMARGAMPAPSTMPPPRSAGRTLAAGPAPTHTRATTQVGGIR